MNKSQFNVLIVEDDVTQGKALQEAFSRVGYKSVLCATSVQALTYAQRMEFHCLIVDCLLPKINGVELVEGILQLALNKPIVYLVTGIFKDKNFIKEAMARTGADMFFIKPLNLEEILSQVAAAFAEFASPNLPSVLKLYASRPIAENELLKLIDTESTIHAFHLPKLYQRLFETTLTGELTLIAANGEVSSVGFSQGKIISVRTPDKESFFGSLAVSHGFVDPEDVLEALKDPVRKTIGQKLIESSSLSPHAIQVILQEQLALRLSQTIQDDVVSLQWVRKKFPSPAITLSETRIEHLMEDWLASKITFDWTKSMFMLWGPFQIEGEFHPRIQGPHTIEEVFSDSHFHEETDVPDMFEALIRGRAFMGSRGERAQDFSFLESRLDKMALDFKHQTYFQFLGLGEKAQIREVNKAFEGLKESFDPGNLPDGCPSEIMEKCTHVFKLIEKSRDTLIDDVERLRYLHLLQNKRSQELMDSEPIYHAAILEIASGHHASAAEKFQGLLDRKLEFRDLRAYRIWSGIKCNRSYSALRLDQIPPEERHSPAYMMAKGVYHKSKGQFKKAFEAFRTAHVLDPRLTVAKHELQKLMVELQKNKSQNRDMIQEFTSAVENLFGKISRRSG